jgi:xanthine dehydrogenase YagT iron-sulfur-binding subunit
VPAQDGAEIVTAGGLTSGDKLYPMQQPFRDHDGFQCGYCMPAQICSVVSMLDEARSGSPSLVTRQTSGPVELTD